MGKDLYGAPWSPNTFKAVRDEDVEVVKKDNVVVDEGREVLNKEGTPIAGYSAYGLCVKASNDTGAV